MKIMTYNIHKGMDSDNKITLISIGEYLKKMNMEVICLQEVLYPQYLALKKVLNYDGVFATNVSKPGMKYGICTFSKNQIYYKEHIFLTSKNEQRGFLFTNVLSQNENINIINTHLGLDKYERYEQINEILDYLIKFRGKIVLCGDFNEKNIAIGKFNDAAIYLNNYDSCTFKKSNSRIDYIFLDKKIKLKQYLVDIVSMSDHYPVIVEINKNM